MFSFEKSIMPIIPNDRVEDVGFFFSANFQYLLNFLSVKIRWKKISVKSSEPLAQVA